MKINNTTIMVNYRDEQLRTLVEEYITMQKHEFTFSELCSYVLFWAKEEGKTANTGLYECNQLDTKDCDRLNKILEKIALEGRIVAADGNTRFVNTKE